MSRNRLSTECDCGYHLDLKDSFTRPLYFHEYLHLIGVEDEFKYPYYREYSQIYGCGVLCPECFTRYYFWIGGKHWVDDKVYEQEFGDTSYWETFNDEPEYKGDDKR